MFSAVLFTLVIILISQNVQLGFSLTVSCVDSKCEGVISEAYALDDYHSRNKELLSFDKDQKIDILAKGTGVHGDKWFGRDALSGQVGYVYSAYLNEVPSSRSSSVISVDVKTLGPQYQSFADDLNPDEGADSLDEALDGDEDVKPVPDKDLSTADNVLPKMEGATDLPNKDNREHEFDDAKKLPEEELAEDKINVTDALADNASELAPDILEASTHAPDTLEASELARDSVESSEHDPDTVKLSELTADAVKSSEHAFDKTEASEPVPDIADVPQIGDYGEQSILNHAGDLDHSFHASDDFHFHDHHGDLGSHEHGDHDLHSHDGSHDHHSDDHFHSHSDHDHNYDSNHKHFHEHGEHHHSHDHVDYGDFNHIEREDLSESLNLETREPETNIGDTAASRSVETDESLIKPVVDNLKDDGMSAGKEDVVVNSESGDKIFVIEGSEELKRIEDAHGGHVEEQTASSSGSSTEPVRAEQGQSSAVSLLVSVVGHLDVMLHNAVDRLPPSAQTVLRREPLGLTPEMSLLSLVTAVVSFLMACAMSCDRRSAKSRRKAHDELLSLQQRLQQAISAKVALEDRVAKAEKQVVNVQQREGSAQEINSKMEKEIRDLKEKEKKCRTEVEQYKIEVSQLTESDKLHTQEAEWKEAENVQLKANIVNMSENMLQLEQRIYNMQTEYTTMKSALAEAQAQAQTMTEEVTVLQQNHDKLALQEVTWKDKVQQLNEQVAKLQAEQATHSEQMQVKQQEVKALQDYCVQMEVYYRQQPPAKATDGDDDVTDKTADVDSQSRISTLLDTAKMSAHIKQLEKEKEEMDNKLKTESESRRDLEEQVAHLQYEMENFRDKYHQAQQQSSEASLRLNVLSEYFKQKELEMQKELGEQQARHKDSSSMLDFVGEKARFTEQQLALYQQQVEDLRKEIQKQEQDYHKLVAAQEKKAHENWLAARKAEREVKEAKSECALLRQRLIDAERRLEQEKTENELLQSSASSSVLNGATPGGLPFPRPIFPAPPSLPRLMSPLAMARGGELPPPPFMPLFRPPLPPPHFGPGDDEHYGGRQSRDWRPSSGSVSPGMQGYADRQLSPRDRQPSLPSTARSSPPLMIDRHSPSLDNVNTSRLSGSRDYSPPPPRDRRVPPSGAQFPPDHSQWAPQPAFRPSLAPDFRPPPPPSTFGFRSPRR